MNNCSLAKRSVKADWREVLQKEYSKVGWLRQSAAPWFPTKPKKRIGRFRHCFVLSR
jgi:hypothetical protein